MILLDFSLLHAETFLGSPQAVHQLVVSLALWLIPFTQLLIPIREQYELVRSTVTLHKQHPVCQKKQATKRLGVQFRTNPSIALRRLLDTASHYE